LPAQVARRLHWLVGRHRPRHALPRVARVCFPRILLGEVLPHLLHRI